MNLDTLVNNCTAFRTWSELMAALETGYVPTLRGKRKNERVLIREIICNGFKVWGNNGKNW